MGGAHPKLSKPTVVNNGMIRNQTLMSLSGHNNQAVVAVGVSSNYNNITHPREATQIRHSNPPQMKFDDKLSELIKWELWLPYI